VTGPDRRVAQVVTVFGETSETFVADAIESVDDAGWTSWLVTVERKRPEVFAYPPLGRTLTAGDAPLRRRAVRAATRRWPKPAGLAADVWSRLDDVGVSVVHAHFGWSGLYAVPLARRLGVPLITTFHASDVTVFPRRRGGPAVYRELFSTMTRAIAVAEYTADALRDIGWKGPIDIVPAGVRIDRFALRDDVPESPPLRVAFVGRLAPVKGVDVLLRALPAVRSALGEVELEIVGDGPERAALEALAAELGVDAAVRFAGARPPAGVRDALRAAHALVMPSRPLPTGEAEGSPVVLKEALSTGVPVVAADTGGIGEVMPPAYRGELVRPGDHAALAARIVAVLGDPAGWPERVRTGRAWAEEQFDWSRLGERTAAIYADACG
jgi:glycosyltransferase involved in cell wall biosynthesis